MKSKSKYIVLHFNDDNGTDLGTIVASEKVFSTGSTGFFATGKVSNGEGERFQVTANIVLIGSKPS